MATLKYIKVTRENKTGYNTNLGEVPVCNEQIISRVALLNKTTETQVSGILSFIGGFTRDVIQDGVMETVHLPYLGKFKPKVHQLQAQAMMLNTADSPKHIILRAIREAERLNKNPRT